ncbi:MAG: HAD hydrolase-like protein, partial [Acidobacteria bacterium]|nr:HAD hydrolase-like protein [Acidobacteriota bacterium]
ALVSNAGFTRAPSLRWLLDYHGLRSHLDLLVFSDEVLIAKPNELIFRQVLAALGLDAEAAVFVGDSGDDTRKLFDALSRWTDQHGGEVVLDGEQSPLLTLCG